MKPCPALGGDSKFSPPVGVNDLETSSRLKVCGFTAPDPIPAVTRSANKQTLPQTTHTFLMQFAPLHTLGVLRVRRPPEGNTTKAAAATPTGRPFAFSSPCSPKRDAIHAISLVVRVRLRRVANRPAARPASAISDPVPTPIPSAKSFQSNLLPAARVVGWSRQ